VPVLDGGEPFARCLSALAASRSADLELIVADDGSRDGSVERARGAGARVVSTDGRRGPAAARNLGARHAGGRYLFFLDADCAIHADALERVAEILRGDPELDAVFGSYDDTPAAPNLVSRYRNLLHHRVHHRGRAEASTFWAGCGAIRRATFEALGGFDEEGYPLPSVEDIDLGVRLRARGGRIRLSRDVLVQHLKTWTLSSMVRTDIARRAAPWTELALRSGGFPRDLNVGLGERASLAVAAGAALAALAALAEPALGLVALALALAFVLLNLDLLGFFARRGGTRLALVAIPLHALHVLSGGVGLVIGTLRHLLARAPSAVDERSGPARTSHESGGERNPRDPWA
jgi:GT2 family glycosyltransferase